MVRADTERKPDAKLVAAMANGDAHALKALNARYGASLSAVSNSPGFRRSAPVNAPFS